MNTIGYDMPDITTCSYVTPLKGNARFKFDMNRRPTRLMLELIRREKFEAEQILPALVTLITQASEECTAHLEKSFLTSIAT